jgi:hypothetical protein
MLFIWGLGWDLKKESEMWENLKPINLKLGFICKYKNMHTKEI